MKGPFIYYTLALKKQIGIYISIIIIPVFMPYFFNMIMNSVLAKPSQLQSKPFTLPLLPQPSRVAYYDEDTYYFSYSPDSPLARDIINQLLTINNLTDVKTRAFQTSSDAEKYITVKSLVPNAKKHFLNASFYSKIICNDLRAFYDINVNNCSVNFSESYKGVLSKQYNIEEEMFDTDINNNPEFKNNIFLHINFNISDEQIGGVPMHIQYEVIHNQTILDETMRRYPDPLGKKFSYSKDAPYWTGYSYTLQEQLDNITINQYTDLTIKKSYSYPEQMSQFDIQAILFDEMTCLLAFALIYILSIIILVQQRGQNYILLKRLGMNTLHNLFTQYVFIFIPSVISGIICAITWHYTGILPYDNITLAFAIFANVMITLLISASSLFFVSLVGENQVFTIVFGCLIAFFIFLVGGMFHAGIFQGNSIFDPSLAPQSVIWVLMFFLPPLGVLGLMDMMTTTIPISLHPVMRGQYVTKVEQYLYPLSYVFNKNQPQYRILKMCFTQGSKYGIQKYGICYYYLPPMYNVVILTLLQSIVILPLSSLWFSYIIPQKGFRRLPIFFFLKSEFWRKLKHLKPGKLVIDLDNITVGYKVPLKQKKKYVLGKNIALKQISYIQEPNTISGIIGECSSGKTTLMSYLAGELDNFNIMRMKSSDPNQQDGHLSFNKQNYEQNSHSKELLINYLRKTYVKPKAIVLENYDLTNPIDAHFIKPYIGYLAQDFSNVWMNFSCYQNVYLSLVLRKSAQQMHIDTKQCKAETLELLTKVGLSEKAVLKRKAVQLSGGMLRRLALANAIAGNPKIILLDELSSGVDPVVKYKIIMCIKDIIKTKNSNIIVSTHDTSEIQQLIQYLTILDDGFLMIKNTTPFDLQQKFDMFNIKFYSKESTCSKIMGDKIKTAIQDYNLINNPENITLDHISPHSIEIQINSKLTKDNIITLNTVCEEIVNEYNFDDYILSKTRLDNAYMQITDYATKEENIKHKPKTVALQIQPTKNRLLQIIKLFIIAEYKNKFPIALVFGVAIIFVGLLFKLQYSLIISLLNNDIQLFTYNKHQDLAYSCLSYCINQYPHLRRHPDLQISQCFTDRLNDQYFDGRLTSTFVEQYQRCAYYFNYLGFDQQYNYYANIGDNQINNFLDGVSAFTIKNTEQQTVQSRAPIQYKKYNQDDINTPKLVYGTVYPSYTNYTELYQQQGENTFDPSINKTNLGEQDLTGIVPFILPYNTIYQDEGCTMNDNGRQFCQNIFVTHENTCGDDDNFNLGQCLEKFESNQCDPQTIVFKQINTANVIDSNEDYMDLYRQTLQEKNINVTMDLNNYTDIFDNINKYDKIISPANFEFTQWDVKYQQSSSQQYPRLSGNISIKQTNLLPNTGNDNINFGINKLFLTSAINNYQCNNSYGKKQKAYHLAYPSILKSSQNIKLESVLPTHPHVILFNKPNEPMVKLTSAILRKQMFNAVNNGNYTPWNSTYSLVSRPMPKISNPDVEIHVDISDSMLPQALLIVLLPVSIIFVSIYISVRQALENENNTIRLLRYHFVSPLMWYVSNYVTNLLIGLMMTLLMLVIILIIQPNILIKTPHMMLNIPCYILSGVFCVSYGMFSSFLIKKVRYTLIINFIIALFIAFFNIFLLGNDGATYFIGFFLSSYVMQYYYFRILNDQEIGVGMIFYGLFVSILQVVGGYVIFYFQDIINDIKIFWNNKKQKEKTQYDAPQNNEEASLIAHHTSYDLADDENRSILLDIFRTRYTYYNGTQALKNINIQIERGLIFGLLGSNGSGKSTLMSLLAGVLKSQSGKAVMHIDGRPNINLFKITQTSKYFSVVPQHDLYWGNLTIYDHLKYIAMINCLQTKIDLGGILQSLELDEYAGQKVCNLSGGMKRKISIGMALTLQSPIIAFDEPSCGLGVTTKRQLHESIRRVLNNNTTVIIISHDMEEIEQLTDKCCIMSKGEVIASGSISQLRKQSPYGLSLHIRAPKENVEALSKTLFAIETEYNQNADLWRIQYGQQITETNILAALKEQNLLSCEWDIEKQLMENIFIDLVRSRELQ